MKLRSLVISLALLAVFASDSWGQSKQPPSKTSQQNTPQQERGTDNSPVVVKVIPAEKPKEELESEKAKRISDDQLVKFTGDLADYTKLLFAATALLFLATAGLVVAGFRQVKDARKAIAAAVKSADAAVISADAAKLNAQAVIDAERAHLFVVVVQHNVIETIQAGHNGRRDPSIEKTKMNAPVLAYIFRNPGKTPAVLEEVMHSMMLEKTEQHTITYETPDRALEIIPGESDLTDRIAVTFDERPFLVEDAMALGDHDLMLFFYSAATYRDIYNRKHKIRHDFLYSAGRFHLINRIEKTIDPEEQGGAETEQTSRTGFFGRPS